MAYDTAPDAFDEYLQIAERTSRECLDHFTKCIHGHGICSGVSIVCIGIGKIAQRPYMGSSKGRAERGEGKKNGDVLYGSPLFDDEIADISSECPFVVNGHAYRKGYYLADGIYPAWSTFVKTFSVARDEKSLKFKRVQEAARKDIERAFGVLQAITYMFRDCVERCDLHVRKTKELRDRKTHNELRKDLVEHLWNNDDE
ncbi:RNA-directed DNA polymerase, eukaryota [Tanacetum coccineum]